MELPNYQSYPSYLVAFDQKWPYIEPYLCNRLGGAEACLGGAVEACLVGAVVGCLGAVEGCLVGTVEGSLWEAVEGCLGEAVEEAEEICLGEALVDCPEGTEENCLEPNEDDWPKCSVED